MIRSLTPTKFEIDKSMRLQKLMNDVIISAFISFNHWSSIGLLRFVTTKNFTQKTTSNKTKSFSKLANSNFVQLNSSNLTFKNI